LGLSFGNKTHGQDPRLKTQDINNKMSRNSSPRIVAVDFDDQMWPVNCAIIVLIGFIVGIVISSSDFSDDRLLYNGYTHLAAIAGISLLGFWGVYKLQAKVRRRLQLCILLSLLLHLGTTLYMYCHPLELPILAMGGLSDSAEPDDDLVAPDYNWNQAEEPEAEQAFETPVNAAVREETPPAAILKPRDVQRPVPVADVPRLAGIEAHPLGAPAAGKPLTVRRAPGAAPQEIKPAAALAVARQAPRPSELPAADPEPLRPVPAARTQTAELLPAPTAAQAAPVATNKGDSPIFGPTLRVDPRKFGQSPATLPGTTAGGRPGVIVARSGVPLGKGSARPSVLGVSQLPWAQVRDGSPDSISNRGVPLPLTPPRGPGGQSGSGDGEAGELSAAAGPVAILPRTGGRTDLPSTGAEAAGPADAIALAPAAPAGATSPSGLEAGASGANVVVTQAKESGRRLGTPPGAGNDPADISGLADLASPPLDLLARRRERSDADLVKLVSRPTGEAGVNRSSSDATLEGGIREPTEFYRRRAAHRRAFGPSGGEGFTEPAVENGLDFLTHVQFPDGHWSLDRLPKGVDAASFGLAEDIQSDTAATGLSLLAYLGAGYTHLDEKHRDTVRRAVWWLAKRQKADGDLFAGGSSVARFYSHGIAAMALCEVYGMTQDPELRGPAQKAIDFIVRSQDPEGGGWRYDPGKDSDTSVTGWQLMALRSAQMAGLDVPQETLNKIGVWLDHAQPPEQDGRYIYKPGFHDTQHDANPNPAMTAEGMVMRMYLGQRRSDPQLIRGAEYLKTHLPEVGTKELPLRNCYYWYYGTQAMYQMQGDYWTAWSERLGPLLRAGQVAKGTLAGSWHPTEPVRDYWSHTGGRLYVTTMHLLMLEVGYRHLPLFQELSK
jgi:hypothetical protein